MQRHKCDQSHCGAFVSKTTCTRWFAGQPLRNTNTSGLVIVRAIPALSRGWEVLFGHVCNLVKACFGPVLVGRKRYPSLPLTPCGSPKTFPGLEAVLRLLHCGTMAMGEPNGAGSRSPHSGKAGLRASFHLSGVQEMSQATGRMSRSKSQAQGELSCSVPCPW